METRHSRAAARIRENQRGFSLIEAVVAAGIVAGAFAALAQMFALSIARNTSARHGSVTMMLAGQKMEELRALTWGVGLLSGGALDSDVSGYVDYIDQDGNILATSGAIPPSSVYLRRWAVEFPPAIPDALMLQVLVTRLPSRAEAAPKADAARLVTLRVRKTP
jgi:hypothetical protein